MTTTLNWFGPRSRAIAKTFGQIVARYQSLIATLTYSATGSIGQSEDLAQETFVTAWSQLSGLREPEKLRSWLCGIARNLVNNSLRKQKREPSHAAEPIEEISRRIAFGPRRSRAPLRTKSRRFFGARSKKFLETYSRTARFVLSRTSDRRIRRRKIGTDSRHGPPTSVARTKTTWGRRHGVLRSRAGADESGTGLHRWRAGGAAGHVRVFSKGCDVVAAKGGAAWPAV